MAPPSPRAYAFAPRSQVRPFYQWLNNNGYCGEVSLLAAGMANGQWISQFNARSIASPFPLYPQTGKPSGINFYSQMLLDDLAKPGTTTANSFGQAASWMRLDAVAYPSATQATGAAGARHFLAWIKARIVAGDQVTLGVIDALDRSLPYSHIVSVVRIESNYPAGDTAYHADDVLYVEDHGLITLPGANPAIPPGTTGTGDCTPFVFGYTFANWTSPVSSQRIYGIPVPGGRTRNYAYAIPGVQDPQHSTLPVRLEILSNGYPANPIAGYQYEAPMIGKSAYGASNTNTPPAPATLVLRATVSGLVPGATYNLYLYRTAARPLAGPWPSLPTANFNANASLATNRISFTATADTYSVTVTVPSSSSVAFRAVSTLAP